MMEVETTGLWATNCIASDPQIGLLVGAVREAVMVQMVLGVVVGLPTLAASTVGITGATNNVTSHYLCMLQCLPVAAQARITLTGALHLPALTSRTNSREAAASMSTVKGVVRSL
jgi:hypothetical protein